MSKTRPTLMVLLIWQEVNAGDPGRGVVAGGEPGGVGGEEGVAASGPSSVRFLLHLPQKVGVSRGTESSHKHHQAAEIPPAPETASVIRRDRCCHDNGLP